MAGPHHHFPTAVEFRRLFKALLAPEAEFYKAVVVYSIAISLLTLAVPISVQMLIDTIANTALIRLVVGIAVFLFVLLIVSGLLYALRAYAMELFKRRIFARVASEMAMTTLTAKGTWLESSGQEDLSNRFFDIMTLKKNVPDLLTNGFSLFLQLVIGFVLVSFYHQYFFILSLVILALMVLIWEAWGWRAINTAFSLSESKYQAAAWLQELADNHDFFKSARHANFALEETERVIEDHIGCQRRHFRYKYRQLLSLLLLYALSSSVLLGLGGWLVIRGELSLGQLVAAELVMSAIFAAFPYMATYLGQFYDLCAAVEEISRFNQVPIEDLAASDLAQLPKETESGALEMRNVRFKGQWFNLALPAGSMVVAGDAVMEAEKAFGLLFRRHEEAESGAIYLGGVAAEDYALSDLRQRVAVVNRLTLLPMSIKSYMRMRAPEASAQAIREALESTGFDLASLKQGLDTKLSVQGGPFQAEEVVRFKLAAMLLIRPRLLVLGHLGDLVEQRLLARVLAKMRMVAGTTVIYFTRRQGFEGVTHILLKQDDTGMISSREEVL